MNVYTDEQGVVQPHIQVRLRKRSGLLEVIDRSPSAVAQRPDALFGVDDRGQWTLPARSRHAARFVQGGVWSLYTRLWMAIAPPEGTDPGYACVVGERYSGQIHAIQRPLYLLDETASALLPDLFLGAAALKDLYLADRLFYDPRNERFAADLQRSRWGLCAYPQEAEWPDVELRKLHPHYANRDRIVSPCEPPYVPDDDWGRVQVDALLAKGLLGHHPCTEVFANEPYRTPHRALSMVVMALQAFDWGDRLEAIVRYDGYEQPEEAEARERDEDGEATARAAALLYAVGDQDMRTRVLEARQGPYEDDGVGADLRRRVLVEADSAWLG